MFICRHFALAQNSMLDCNPKMLKCFKTLHRASGHRCLSTSTTATHRVQYDAIVVGGGIAGSSVAYELANNHNLNVIILEQEYFAGYHSTGRAAGLFAENYGTDAVKLLTMASRDWFENPPLNCNPNVSENPFFTPAGTLATSTPENQDILIESQYNSTPCQDQLLIIDRETAKQIHPLLNYDDPSLIGDKFVYDPNATALDIGNTHQSYVRGCNSNKIPILCDQKVDIITKCNDNNCNWEIVTNVDNNNETKKFESRILVNAAGAWADDIAVKAGLNPLNIRPLRRCLVIFKPHNDEIKKCVDAHIDDTNEFVMPWLLGVNEKGKEFWYCAPQGKSGLVLCSPANTDEDEPCDAWPTDLEIAICIDRIETFTKFKIPKIEAKWAGLRCYSQDSNFIIGEDYENDSFFWCAGLAGQGIQAAPGYSQLLANRICGKPMTEQLDSMGFDVNSILPKRFMFNRAKTK